MVSEEPSEVSETTTPDYYRLPGIRRDSGDPADVGDVIEAADLDYWLGSIVAHVIRAGRKPNESRLDALENAAGCLDRAIEREKGRQ